MPKPTEQNPSIKYVVSSRKGLPIHQWCKTYFTFNGKDYKQVQEWSQEKPE